MEFKTTFWSDFTIADAFGRAAIEDTFNRAFKEWKDNYVYLTELAIVTNWKCWHHYHDKRMDLSKVYSDMYYQCREYALNNLKGEELNYYWKNTD